MIRTEASAETTTERALRRQARRAYELGRLRMALRDAWPVLPMVALSWWLSRTTPLVILSTGALLLVSVIGMRFRGGVYGQVVTPGLLAGIAPLLLPLVLRSSGHCCIGGACWSLCMLGCIGGGMFAGVSIGVTAAAQPQERWVFASAASLLASLAGMLGCTVIGTAGIIGMAAAVLATSLPVAWVARPGWSR